MRGRNPLIRHRLPAGQNPVGRRNSRFLADCHQRQRLQIGHIPEIAHHHPLLKGIIEDGLRAFTIKVGAGEKIRVCHMNDLGVLALIGNGLSACSLRLLGAATILPSLRQ